MCRKWYKKVHSIRSQAATKIQRGFRNFYQAKVVPRRKLYFQTKFVPMIQKMCRGYLSRKTISNDIKQAKLLLTFEYFEKIRDKLQKDAAFLILFHLKKHFKRMREERNKQELKKAQASLNKQQKAKFHKQVSSSKNTLNP